MARTTARPMIRIAAAPFDYLLAPGATALVVIDMQRDFIEPGGFGAALGNDVSRLVPAIAPIAALLAAWRARGWPVLHTREAHRPDLSDCPPAKRLRGSPALRIGDVGPMGRLLVAGEPGTELIAALAPAAGEWVFDKPGKGTGGSTPAPPPPAATRPAFPAREGPRAVADGGETGSTGAIKARLPIGMRPPQRLVHTSANDNEALAIAA